MATVLAASCGDHHEASPGTIAPTAAAPRRPVPKPIAGFGFRVAPRVLLAKDGTAAKLDVIIKLERRLPRGARPTILVDNQPARRLRALRRHEACYAAELFTRDNPLSPTLRAPVAAQPVTVRLRIDNRPAGSARASLQPTRRAGYRAEVTRMGCAPLEPDRSHIAPLHSEGRVAAVRAAGRAIAYVINSNSNEDNLSALYLWRPSVGEIRVDAGDGVLEGSCEIEAPALLHRLLAWTYGCGYDLPDHFWRRTLDLRTGRRTSRRLKGRPRRP